MKKYILVLMLTVMSQVHSQSNENRPVISNDNTKQTQLIEINPPIQNIGLESKYQSESPPKKTDSVFDDTISWLKKNEFFKFFSIIVIVYLGYTRFKRKKLQGSQGGK
jgi:hypothetical protein